MKRHGQTFEHLDFWRLVPTGSKSYLFGPVELTLTWSDNDDEFVRFLIPTPRHGCLWTDAEALGFIGAAVSKEASRIAARINRAFRRALFERAGEEFKAGPLLRSFQNKSGGYGDVPASMTRGFAFNDGMAWMTAFGAAINGGITDEEVARLNKVTLSRFTREQLRRPSGFRLYREYNKDVGFIWNDMAANEPLYRAIILQAEVNNDSPTEWGDIQVNFGWGWLSSHRKKTPRHMEMG